MSKVAFVLAVALFTSSTSSAPQDDPAVFRATTRWHKISEKFRDAEIVPDIIDACPLSELDITYARCGKDLKPGTKLTPLEAEEQPIIHWKADPKKFYFVIMLDPDAPSRKNPTVRSYLHWAVGNIPGNKVGLGEELAEYWGPAPPENTGHHRYVVLVYEQLYGKVAYNSSVAADDANREKFSMRAAVNNLRLKNPPVAGNYFQAKNQS